MIAIGSDHGGYDLKVAVISHLKEQGIACKDYGCNDKSSCDYPIYGRAVAEAVAQGECEKGIVICTTNDANVLALGGGIVGSNLACSIVDAFLHTEFSGEEKHCRRVGLIE